MARSLPRHHQQAVLGHHLVVPVIRIRSLIRASVMYRKAILSAEVVRSIHIVKELNFDRVLTKNRRAGLSQILALLRRRYLTHDGVSIERTGRETHARGVRLRVDVGRVQGFERSPYLVWPRRMVQKGRRRFVAMRVRGKLHRRRKLRAAQSTAVLGVRRYVSMDDRLGQSLLCCADQAERRRGGGMRGCREYLQLTHDFWARNRQLFIDGQTHSSAEVKKERTSIR